MDSFDSVDAFLKAARSAKRQQEALINERLAPFLDDKSTVAVTPDMLEVIDTLIEKYGDEPLRATAMFCIGKWMRTHQEILEQHIENEDVQAALWVMNDISKLSLILNTLEDIGSFGGDDDWRKMIKDVVSKTVIENLEEKGVDIDQWLRED